jgi:hypothetical protein
MANSARCLPIAHTIPARMATAYNEAMSNPWLDVPLKDYEDHMSSAEVEQLHVLAELFKYALDCCRPESVAVLGIAGGNGLEQIDRSVTKRIVGVDINQQYLEEVQRRFETLAGLELHRRDLTEQGFDLAPVAMVHAALIFEHVGLGAALDNAVALVAPGGWLSMVLQLPSVKEDGVASTRYSSLQTLKRDFALIDGDEVQRHLRFKRFHLIEQENRSLPAGKAFWLGIFARIS